MSLRSLLKKAHLPQDCRRQSVENNCARPCEAFLASSEPHHSNVLLKYASARGFVARLASGTFLIRLRTGVFQHPVGGWA